MMQVRQPDYSGKYLTKSIAGNMILSRDGNGYMTNAQPVNYIKKGMCKFGEIIESSDNFVILKNDGKISRANKNRLNAELSKSASSFENISTPVLKVTGTFDTVAGKVSVTDIDDAQRTIFTDPDLVRKTKKETMFIKSIGGYKHTAKVKNYLFSNMLLKSIESELLSKNKLLIKGINTTFTPPKLPKTEEPKIGGIAWNTKGGQKPTHKYLERKPNPKGEGYIYLYELPDGSQDWKDEAGKSVDTPNGDEYKIDYQAGESVSIGDKIGRVKEISDNFIAINIEGEIKLFNKKEHIQKIQEQSKYKTGDHVSTDAGEGTLIQVTDNLALLKTDKDNKLKVIHLEKQIKPYNNKIDKANVYKHSYVYQGYGEQQEQEDDIKELEQLPEYKEFQDAATKAGLGQGEIERKKFVKVGNDIRTVKWKFNKTKNDVDFIIDGVPDLQLNFMDDKYYIRDITEDGYSLESMSGEKGLFLDHKSYEQYKPKEEEVEFEKNVDHLGSMLVKYPKRTFHFSGELSPEQEEKIAEIKSKEKGYKPRWKTKEDKIQTAAEISKIKKENEIKKDEIKAVLGSKEYESFKKKADERGFNFGENKLTANKTVDIEGKKFDVTANYNLKSGEKIDIDGPTKVLKLGENDYRITDITKGDVYYDEDGKEKNISIEELKSINGRSIFEPTKASKGLISKNKAQKFYFGTDEKNTASGYYEIIEAKDLIASHKAGGEANKNYNIGDAQNRDRSAPQSIAQINKIAANPNFDFLADNRTAQDGAPIVNQDYNVVAGNGRAIGTQLHYQNGGEKYKNDLMNKAEELGFTKDEVSKMQEPVLVRRINVDNKEAQRLGALSNTSNMLATEGREEAKGKATRIDDRTFNNLADIFKNAKGDHTSITDYLDEVGPDIIKELSEKGIIPDNERHLYYNTSTGKLDASHKDKVKQLLTQSILGDSSQHFEKIPDAAREGITKGLGELFALKGQTGDLIPHLQNAVKILAKYDAQKGSFANPDDWISQAQNDMLEPLKGNKKDLAMFELLTNTKPNEIKNSIKEYVQIMEGDMFEPGLNAEEAFDKVFKPKYKEGINKSIFARTLFFGKRLLKGMQLELFTGQEEEGKKLLPSKKNPAVRRWQNMGENEEQDMLILPQMMMQDDKKLKELKNWEECYLYDPINKTRKHHIKGEAKSINIPEEIVNNSEGYIFTHNHPSGAPFSANDIFMMLDARLKTMRAVGSNGNLYVMTIADQEVFDKYTSVPRDELLKRFNIIYNNAYHLKYYEYVRKVSDNIITIYQAQFEHYNGIWNEIAPQIGCKYEVKVNYVD